MVILIDNGHGSNTPGKCSPDKQLREYKWAREVATRLQQALKAQGITSIIVTPEETDTPLSTRVARINSYCAKYGAKNCLLISLHLNAAGADGKWHEASGWSGWVSNNASSNSKLFASLAHIEAEKLGLKGNRSVPAGRYWQANFYILKNTKCPAVLTENLFQDNRKEAAYLMTDTGKKAIVDLHVSAIKKYIQQRR